MRAGETRFALDREGVVGEDGGVFGGPGDVVAGEEEGGGVLGVEGVCVAEGGGGVDVGDGDGGYGEKGCQWV